jgi:hypothetical protein
MTLLFILCIFVWVLFFKLLQFLRLKKNYKDQSLPSIYRKNFICQREFRYIIYVPFFFNLVFFAKEVGQVLFLKIGFKLFYLRVILLKDKKSTTRYVFRFGSSPITWGRRKQSCITLSSIKVEYMAFTSGAKEAIRPRRLLAKIQIMDSNEPTKLMCNNQSAIKLLKNPMFLD